MGHDSNAKLTEVIEAVRRISFSFDYYFKPSWKSEISPGTIDELDSLLKSNIQSLRDFDKLSIHRRVLYKNRFGDQVMSDLKPYVDTLAKTLSVVVSRAEPAAVLALIELSTAAVRTIGPAKDREALNLHSAISLGMGAAQNALAHGADLASTVLLTVRHGILQSPKRAYEVALITNALVSSPRPELASVFSRGSCKTHGRSGFHFTSQGFTAPPGVPLR